MNIKPGKLKVNLVSETPFTVQGHGVHTAFLEAIESLRKIGVEVKVNSKENCDIVHIHTIGPFSLMKLLKNRKKAVVTAHVVPNSFIGSLVLARLWLPLAKIYLRFFYNRARALIAVSPQVKKELKELGVKRDIYFIPNGVNLDEFKKDQKERAKIRKKLNIKKDEFVVLNVGQIQPRKGIETFVKTAQKLPNIKFIWVGGTPFKFFAASYGKMKKIQNEAPRNVIFAGDIPFRKMPSYYNAADILFFPSYQENFPFTIVEAAASRLPLLLRNLKEYEPIFDDNFVKGEENNFKDLILKLENDKNFYEKYSKKAYEIAQKYEEVKLVKELLKIYGKILEDKSK